MNKIIRNKTGQSYGDASLGRDLEHKEFRELLAYAMKLGLQRLDY